MYLDQDNWKGKVGRINILRRGNSLRLRFTYRAHNRIEIEESRIGDRQSLEGLYLVYDAIWFSRIREIQCLVL